MSKLYDVTVPNGTYTDRNGQEKTAWLRVGAVIENKNGNLNLILNAIPAPVTGREKLAWMMNPFPVEQRQEQPQQASAQQEPQQSGGDTFSDDIPFAPLDWRMY